MKKIAMVLVCFALVSMTVKAQLAQIALMHDGNATMFNSNQTSNALAAAVDGDVLYFTEGSFSGDITITKKVSLVGVGEGTILNGDVTINLTESAATMPAQMLDAMQLTGSITMRSNTNGVKIRKCKFDSFKYYNTASTVTTNCTIDRCFINGTMNLGSKVEGMSILSSKIKNLQGMAATASGATLVNCNIWNIPNNSSNSRLLATLINSIIFSSYSGNSYIHKDCMFINCLGASDVNVKGLMKGGVMNNCYTDVIFYMDSQTMETSSFVNCSLEDYLGTDGTVVGITGGTAPFTLVPAAPRITESVIKVDPETKKLNVNLKVTAN